MNLQCILVTILCVKLTVNAKNCRKVGIFNLSLPQLMFSKGQKGHLRNRTGKGEALGWGGGKRDKYHLLKFSCGNQNENSIHRNTWYLCQSVAANEQMVEGRNAQKTVLGAVSSRQKKRNKQTGSSQAPGSGSAQPTQHCCALNPDCFLEEGN